MLRHAIAAFWIAVKTVLCGCHADHHQNQFEARRNQYTVSRLTRLPARIGESSGLAFDPVTHTLWTHNDGGSPPELFRLDSAGQLQETRLLSVPNIDWEDLARTPDGTLYIGDFGNNFNNRRDLVIYQVPPLPTEPVKPIHFRYENQHQFPPPQDSLNFDCEAFFYHADSLYLFSKNRGRGPVSVYALPAQAGTFVARRVGQIRINRMVTGAAISPSGHRFALLTYGKILIFALIPGQPLLGHPLECLRFSHAQTEGITFMNDSTLLVSNEQQRLFRIQPKR